MSFNQFLLILKARRWLALSILGVTVLAAVVASLLLPKSYVATTSLVVDQRGADPVTGTYFQTQQTSAEYLATQVDIIDSHNVAAKVVDKLKLTDAPVVRSDFLKDTDGSGSVRDWLADKLLKKLDVTPSRDSSVIAISYTSSDARYAAQLANAFADAYIQTGLELKTEPAKRQAAWYQDQTAQLRQTLENTQKKLAAYQQQSGLVSGENRLDTESSRLSNLTTQLATAQGLLADAQSRQKQLQDATASGQVEQLPDVLGNTLIQSMKGDLARAEGKLAESAEKYGTGHPDYIASLAEVNALRGKIRSEVATLSGSIRQSLDLAQQRVTELQQSINEQKTRILALQKGNDEQSVLAQDVDNAQKAYDAALQRTSQVRMQSQVDQSTVAILNPAIVPDKPARPRVLINTLLSIILGSMLAVATVLFAELMDRRVRSEADLKDVAGLDVLATVPHGPGLAGNSP